MIIKILTKDIEPQYNDFILSFADSLFYHSLLFKKLLKELFHFEDYYLVAVEDDNIIGVLPAFLSKTSLGNSLNSLPFFGSNGGMITHRKDNEQIKIQLLRTFYELAEEKNCLTSTIINSPFEENPSIYDSFNPDFYDRRIGQITDLPQYNERIEEELLYMYSAFTRRMIRKALKNSVVVKKERSGESLDFLKYSHIENMRHIGGKIKPPEFFEYVYENFRFDKDYTIWVAYYGDTPIASLLLFYFNNTVEYYIPAITRDYRSIQPLSLIIFKAMVDASKKGYKYWNWGGTWPDQEGVYRFKKKWNARNIAYQHFIKIHNQEIFNYSPDEVSSAFPYFYVIPFDQLNSVSKDK